MVHLEEKVLEV